MLLEGKGCAEAGSVRAAKTIAMLKKCVCRRVQWLEDEAAGIEAGLEKVREWCADAKRRG